MPPATTAPLGAIESKASRSFVLTLAVKYRYMVSVIEKDVIEVGRTQPEAGGTVVVSLWSLIAAPRGGPMTSDTGAETPSLARTVTATEPCDAISALPTVASNC